MNFTYKPYYIYNLYQRSKAVSLTCSTTMNWVEFHCYELKDYLSFFARPKVGLIINSFSEPILIIDFRSGRGVFASQSISAGTVIDVSPVLIFGNEEMTSHISQTRIDDYT